MFNPDLSGVLSNHLSRYSLVTATAKRAREITDEAELEKLEDAIAFKNISNMPARVKCALLAWHTLEDILDKNDNNK